MSAPPPLPADPTPGDAERRRIAGRAGIVALGTLASRALGLGRDVVLAAYFSRAATDAWMIAFQIPNMLRQLFAEGAVQTSVLPVLTAVREKRGEAEAQQFFQALRGLSMAILLVVSALGSLLAPWLVDLFASGFRERPGQHELTTLLTRWAFPYIFFMGASSLGVAALNSHRRFVATSFAPALLNVAFIAFAFGVPTWLTTRGQPPILAMALGALVGGLLQVVAQWPSLKRIGYLRAPTLQWRNPALGETLRRLTPGLLGVGVYYIDVIIGRRLLSELGEGAVTYFSYALRLCDFSQGIFIMALSAATLPSLAAFAARGQLDEVGKTFAYSMRHALFIGVAASGATVVLAKPLVSLLLQHGAFDGAAVQETSRALVAQGVSIFLVAGVRQLVLVYFALGETRSPVRVAIVDLAVFFAVSVLLRERVGHVGVSWGVTAARVVQFSLLFWGLRGKLPSTHAREIGQSAVRSVLAALPALVLTWLVLRTLGVQPAGALWGRALPLLLGAGTFMATFVAAAVLLRCNELSTASQPLVRRWRRLTRSQ